mmetsp:Transcript_6273/g.7660  ORF Transcript_6273/g.7660 Transcript_6273/m.7660 type:complete len:328 (-) Transcript_6273:247-1230(-)|eukprot:CAMPEP_0114341832 /NCGR_PEP_ID=MMETSP0101-20121206/9329_1 /TAXON_ID=38822 ORGANISM="Pteridomonas danica, Strain PT" /NCGR_SAMPLE_ID=MMETSP0101 /ASSEMBLY_ACC=CAM_ASM_000211 /LENGTH=327 /DNA_ID=CAMNT_0001475605 /DNA_START=71 /DNA_END=1054 /DNA_ORIENTATION=+
MAEQTDQVIGMMDGAYFTGRKDILDWINSTLALGVTKIETTCTGAVACQLLDAHFPGNVQMSKVNWEARNDYEYVNNYKILQSALLKLNISKTADIEKLSRGKYQDNLEFMQWFKGFCSNHSVAEGYDPIEARSKGKGVRRVSDIFGKPGTKVTTVKARRHTASGAMGAAANAAATSVKQQQQQEEKQQQESLPIVEKENYSKPNSMKESQQQKQKESNSSSNSEKQSNRAMRNSSSNLNSNSNSSISSTMKKELNHLQTENIELKLHIEGVEKERDFFFGKLRDIENLLQYREEESKNDGSESGLSKQILDILYATTEDFVVVDDE